MKSPVIQFFKVEIFKNKMVGIIFSMEFILGIFLIILSKFNFLVIWPFCLLFGWIILSAIENFKEKVCPHCYGELTVTDENLNILITQKKIVKKCENCGKEYTYTAHYLD